MSPAALTGDALDAALFRFDRNTVVQASAGTGKTFTIEHLVLRLLFEDRAKLEEILVVTFTEKATADLRQRIRSRIDRVLAGRGAENKADGNEVTVGEEQRGRLENALFSFERAPIHTIHSFCQRTLSELAFLTGAPFAADIVDAQEAFHDAFRAELREGLAREPSWKRMVEAWLAEHDAESLETLLYEAHRLRYSDTGASVHTAAAIEALAAGFDAVIATRLETDGAGRVTGRYDGGNCYGAEKARRLGGPFGGAGVGLYGYGGRRGEREVRAMADHAHYREMPGEGKGG